MAGNNLHSGIISLKLVGFKAEDRSKFESIFAIAENRFNAPWQIVSEVEADFYLLGHRLRMQMDQNSLLRTLPRERCIFYAHEETDSEENELIVGAENMPSLRSLLTLFNTLSTLLGSSSTKTEAERLKLPPETPDTSLLPNGTQSTVVDIPAQTKNTTNSSEDTRYFDPEPGFIGMLLNGKTRIYRFDLETDGSPARLYIDLEQKAYYSASKLEQLNPFFTLEQETATTLSEATLQQEVAECKLKSKPLNHLIWYSVFSCSQGRAWKGYQESDIVHLRRWPDINLPGCRELIRLAAFMQSNAVVLSVVHEMTGFPMQQIYNFYNACYAIDLVRKVQQTDVHEKEVDEETQKLFAQIGDRLNLAKS